MLIKKEMIEKVLTTRDVFNKIKYYSDHGFDCYIEGCGDGTIRVIAEDKAITFK